MSDVTKLADEIQTLTVSEAKKLAETLEDKLSTSGSSKPSDRKSAGNVSAYKKAAPVGSIEEKTEFLSRMSNLLRERDTKEAAYSRRKSARDVVAIVEESGYTLSEEDLIAADLLSLRDQARDLSVLLDNGLLYVRTKCAEVYRRA